MGRRAADRRAVELLLARNGWSKTLEAFREELNEADKAGGAAEAGEDRDQANHLLVCSECGETFSRQFTLDRHIKRKHRPAETHNCDQCNKRYKNVEDLTSHRIREHSRIIQSVCVLPHSNHVDTVSKDGEIVCSARADGPKALKHSHGSDCGCANVVRHDDHWDFLVSSLDNDHEHGLGEPPLQVCWLDLFPSEADS